MLFCVHVCIQLCTHVYTVVYTRVHRGDHYYFVSGLLSAVRNGSPLLVKRARIRTTNGLVPTLWIAFSLRLGGLLSSSSRLPYK